MDTLQNSIHQVFGIENKDDSTAVAGLFKRETLAKNDFLLKTGKYCNKFAFVESGVIRVFSDVTGKEVTQWIATPGYFVTDLSAFWLRSKGRWSMQALTDCSLYTISHEDYLKLDKVVPQWNELEKMFVYKCFITMEDRIFSLISLSSEERYHLLFSQYPELFNQVPLQYLASMIGMTPETLSRIRAKKVV